MEKSTKYQDGSQLTTQCLKKILFYQMHLCPYIFKRVNIESWVQMSLNHEKNLENVVKMPLKIDEKPLKNYRQHF